MRTLDKETQQSLTPAKALDILKADLNSMLSELGSQPTELAMFLENWTFRR